MRNARVADIIYELIWFVEDRLKNNPEYFEGIIRDEITGEVKRGWGLCYGSIMWIPHFLVEVGVLEDAGPIFVVRISAIGCLSADFSQFETYACYVEAMRAFGMHYHWYLGEEKVGKLNVLNIKEFSPYFIQNIAENDDMFSPYRDDAVLLDGDRFDQKIMEPWLKMAENGQIGDCFRSGKS